MQPATNPQSLSGNWRHGWALDFHTVSSVALPGGGFETQRSFIGELLYQLKYHYDLTAVEPIADLAAAFLNTRWILRTLAAIVPVPPSNVERPFQPVEVLAIGIGRRVNLPVVLDYLVKVRSTEALKDIEDPTLRRHELQGAFRITNRSLAGRRVLLFDDLYRSGETLRAITEVLHTAGQVESVYVLTIGKTRTRR